MTTTPQLSLSVEVDTDALGRFIAAAQTIGPALQRMSERMSRIMADFAPRVVLLRRLERPVDRARRLRLERWARARDRRAAQRGNLDRR